MKSSKTIVIVALAIVAIGGAAFMYLSNKEDRSPATEQTDPAGAVNPQSNARELTTEPAPKFSDRTFELPPSDATGSYKPSSAGSAESEQEVD